MSTETWAIIAGLALTCVSAVLGYVLSGLSHRLDNAESKAGRAADAACELESRVAVVEDRTTRSGPS